MSNPTIFICCGKEMQGGTILENAQKPKKKVKVYRCSECGHEVWEDAK